LRRLALSGAVTAQRAGEAVADLANTRIRRYPHAPLRERVWALRDSLAAYDACYLALAEGLDEPVLLTADKGLAAVARGSLGDNAVRHVR
jgi:predicted nucleic acid-binding protein